MVKRFYTSKLFIFFLLQLSCQASFSLNSDFVLTEQNITSDSSSINSEIRNLNSEFRGFIEKGDLNGCKQVSDKLMNIFYKGSADTLLMSDSYYFTGLYNFFSRKLDDAVRLLKISAEFREKEGVKDIRYAKALYNIGTIYSMLGDFKNHESFSVKSLDAEKKIYGSDSPALMSTYLSLIAAYSELQEYEKALKYANIALGIAGKNASNISDSDLSILYSNLGITYMFLADYSKAKIYLEKAESIYGSGRLALNDNYINLINSLAITEAELGTTDKSIEIYERGLAIANTGNSPFADNFVNSYAISLGNSGNKEKGEVLLKNALRKSALLHGTNSRDYILLLTKYADYLREFNIDNNKAVSCYEQCIRYLDDNSSDAFLKNLVFTGYSLSLNKAGNSLKALETIQALLFSETTGNKNGLYGNPGEDSIKPDKKTLKILKTKYKILIDLYGKSPDISILEAASLTSELIVNMLEKVRVNISEEESRLFLGDRYRDSYINAIHDFNLLYTQTGNRKYLIKAFEYSEKSKVAGLLASTRELKAVQFHIPAGIADLEKELQRDISLYNARISEESLKERPDMGLIRNWKENLMNATLRRDSLVTVFEGEYPGYYAIKYNTHTAGLDNISDIVGRNGNYINYIVSDSLIYIFVANRKQQQLLSLKTDSLFFQNVRKFRSLLSYPSPSANARLAFDEFEATGNYLYGILVKPVVPYLISDKLVISPDNILSFIPFETIPVSPDDEKKLLYRNLDYLMNNYDISYTYSATFMAESERSKSWKGNEVIAFAPGYSAPVDINAVMNRQGNSNLLPDLPYARLEAEYVSEITGGVLYENNEAQESVYKKEAGKYDIIHLAMHTLLNDKYPMHSTLIFSPGNDTIEDRYLKTYEVYGIPLKARMVVLSSCNTGAGMLYSGEGILSLARGFIYSGSESVIMSMWEIEDRSGTEIVKKFYEYLLKGNSKSESLRKARMSYLKNADQLRSHPYFWSSLIIYGNNSPLYYSDAWLIIPFLVIAGVVCLFVYHRRRKFSTKGADIPGIQGLP